jgi:hypothetical protein
MTAAGTFALDTNTYLTAESDTLASVTNRGNTTTNAITVGGLVVATNLIYTDLVNSRVGIGTTSPTAPLHVATSVTAASAIARGVYFNQTLVASANGDNLVGLDIAPTFTVGAFTGVSQFGLRVSGTIRGSIFDSAANLRFSSGTSTSYVSFLLNQTALEVGRFHGTTGNLTLQNGGTFTDNGFRLDVVGADSRFNGIRAGLGAGQVAGNTVFGNGALGSNVSGTGIVAIGFEALKVSTGINNTAVGFVSLVGNTSGIDNTAVGSSALRVNATGSGNTAVGLSALRNNTVSNNTALGFESALTNTSGTGITAIGYQALRVSTSSQNTAVGFLSLASTVGGSNNTALGNLTLSLNISGNNNTALGNGALYYNTGAASTAIGNLALFNNTASNNTAVGHEAALTNVSGIGITAVGYQALRNSTGNQNTAIGFQSLLANTTGTSNTAIGYTTGSVITTGSFNTFIGDGILGSTTGNSNSVLGCQATATGFSNTIMGAFSSTAGFSSCVILGRQATATANNQFVVGSTGTIAGAVTTETNTTISSWAVKINGTDRKLLLLDTAQNVIDVKQAVAASTATTTVNWVSGNVADITLTSNTTFTLSNPVIGTYIIKLTQGGAGGFLATWPATIKWSGGIAPVLTTTAGKVDIITLVWDGTNYFGSYALNF